MVIQGNNLVINGTTVEATDLTNVASITSDVQTQLNSKANTSTVNSQVWDYSQMPAGSVLQVVSFTNNSTTATTVSEYDHFNVTITPKSSTSKFFIMCNMKASHTQSTSLYFKIGINDNFDLASSGRGYPSATNSIYMEAYGNSHSSNAQIDQFLGDYMYSHSSSSTFNLKIRHQLQSGTMYLNNAFSYDDLARGRPQSTLTVMEIGA